MHLHKVTATKVEHENREEGEALGHLEAISGSFTKVAEGVGHLDQLSVDPPEKSRYCSEKQNRRRYRNEPERILLLGLGTMNGHAGDESGTALLVEARQQTLTREMSPTIYVEEDRG